ncbi:hypothetical protein CB1_000940018 [Camelus ferus]|nr:hypothetical protein CB1_000940018 [Camelus ferus]
MRCSWSYKVLSFLETTRQKWKANDEDGAIPKTKTNSKTTVRNFGEGTDFLLENFLLPLFADKGHRRFSMVIGDSTVKALRVEPGGISLTYSLAPSSLLQL